NVDRVCVTRFWITCSVRICCSVFRAGPLGSLMMRTTEVCAMSNVIEVPETEIQEFLRSCGRDALMQRLQAEHIDPFVPAGQGMIAAGFISYWLVCVGSYETGDVVVAVPTPSDRAAMSPRVTERELVLQHERHLGLVVLGDLVVKGTLAID